MFVDTAIAATYWLRMISNVKFVSIPITDQDRALAFYTEKLGFTVFTDQPMGPEMRWIELRVGRSNTGIVLFTPDEHKPWIGKPLNIAFQCTDVMKTYEELSARGVEFEGKPEKHPWGWHCAFKDPDGNTFALGD
jgi:predicted enzyme related to lactoylglutathione lyase